ncbi:SRPBCC family protein [Dactylosporangium vinaceum]|uniref:SRPBCC family protein n=1 Tax=Dactylosporangium vinaceum TaxID=53362 RepID=A0ABV5M8Y8_9ACTN|nr:SRPBCC family protein [Dactylosporangium vinaceum]UAB99519.1 SRPBCC family protein [Dactylosporangium vinaceum]
MIDLVNQINATHRELGTAGLSGGGAGRSLLLRRTYDAAVEDVWSACTTPERLARWLAPVSGDLRPGGHYQLEGNAGGTIQICVAPSLLRVTWSMGEGMATEVELRLTQSGDGTLLQLEHASPAEIVDEMVRQYGPGGTIGIGGGWDLALAGLLLHLSGAEYDPATWPDTAEAKAFAARSCAAWGAVVQAAWGTGDDDLAAAVAFATAHFS